MILSSHRESPTRAGLTHKNFKKLGELKTEVKKAERTLEGGPEESRALEEAETTLKEACNELEAKMFEWVFGQTEDPV